MMLAGIVTSQEQVDRTGKTAARQSNLEDKLDSQTTETHQGVKCWGLEQAFTMQTLLLLLVFSFGFPL